MATLALQPVFAHPSTHLRRQRALWCRVCGAEVNLIAGYCSRCYAQRHRDRVYFGGLRARVLARDNYHCQACGRRGEGKRSLAVHHRRPGVSRERWLVTLCLGCHARVHRLLVWRHHFAKVLPHAVQLWREQHPGAPEQLVLNFAATGWENDVPIPLELPL